VIKALLDLGLDLMGRDADRHLAVCRAVTGCRVEVVNVLLGAHAVQNGGDEGAKAVLECPCTQVQEQQAYPLLFHALDTVRTTTPENQLAMVRCLVQKWGADVRAVICSGAQKCEYFPLYDAAMGCAHNVVAFFLDECGMDINIRTPRTQSTVLHSLVRTPVRDEGEALRMLKYLIEERGADYTLKSTDGYNAVSLAVICGVPLYSRYFAPGGTTTREVDPATFKRYQKRERRKDVAKAAAKDEAATKALFDEQEAKAKEAAATLLAELEAEDRKAAAVAGKKKQKKKKKKGAGGEQATSAAATASIAAVESAVSCAADLGLEESKMGHKKLAPQATLQEEDQEQQRQGQEQQKQEQQQQPHDGGGGGDGRVLVPKVLDRGVHCALCSHGASPDVATDWGAHGWDVYAKS
jgi:hypothetical protein